MSVVKGRTFEYAPVEKMRDICREWMEGYLDPLDSCPQVVAIWEACDNLLKATKERPDYESTLPIPDGTMPGFENWARVCSELGPHNEPFISDGIISL